MQVEVGALGGVLSLVILVLGRELLRLRDRVTKLEALLDKERRSA